MSPPAATGANQGLTCLNGGGGGGGSVWRQHREGFGGGWAWELCRHGSGVHRALVYRGRRVRGEQKGAHVRACVGVCVRERQTRNRNHFLQVQGDASCVPRDNRPTVLQLARGLLCYWPSVSSSSRPCARLSPQHCFRYHLRHRGGREQALHLEALGPHPGSANDALSDTGETTSHFGPNFPFSD